jgi:hypothetical protein
MKATNISATKARARAKDFITADLTLRATAGRRREPQVVFEKGGAGTPDIKTRLGGDDAPARGLRAARPE